MKEKLKPNKVYFKEEQSFAQSPMMWVMYVVFLVSVVPLAIGMYQQLVLGKPWGNEPVSNNALIETFVFIFIFMAFLVVFFARVKLEISINQEGIVYRFPFFILKKKLIARGTIARYEIRKYKALIDYGGWGYKKGLHRRLKRLNKWGAALTIKGNIGLQLYFENGSKLLIGTQRAEGIRRAMEKMMEKEKISL